MIARMSYLFTNGRPHNFPTSCAYPHKCAMSQKKLTTFIMAFLISLIALSAQAEVPTAVVVDNSIAYGAICGSSSVIEIGEDSLRVSVTIENPKHFWTEIITPYESPAFKLEPKSIFAHIGYLPPDGSATYEVTFYRSTSVLLGVDVTLESGPESALFNIFEIILKAIPGALDAANLEKFAEIIDDLKRFEEIVLAADYLYQGRVFSAAWEIFKIQDDDTKVSALKSILSRVGVSIAEDVIKDGLTLLKIWDIAHTVFDELRTLLFGYPAGFIEFRAFAEETIEPFIIADISANPKSGHLPLAVTFDASSSLAWQDTIETYSWAFGDGDTDTGQIVQHTYTKEGFYTATLTITSAEERADTASIVIGVGDTHIGPTLVPGGTISVSTCWIEHRSPYVIQGSVTIPEGITLTISAGVVVKHLSYCGLNISGTLVADGTADERIIFTSYKDDEYGGDTNGDGDATSPAPGDWQSLYFFSTSTDSLLDHVFVKYGGHGSSDSNIYTTSSSLTITSSAISDSSQHGIYCNSSSPAISGNTISNNAQFGIYLISANATITDNTINNNSYGIHGNSSPGATITGNTLSENSYAIYLDADSSASTITGNTITGNNNNGIHVHGSFSLNATWSSDEPYVIHGSVTIPEGITLTISAGVVVKHLSYCGLNISGTLVADGTADERIIFTSYKDDEYGGDTNGDGDATSPAPGDWQSLYFFSTSTDSLLDHVFVKYGGHGSSDSNIYTTSSSLTITSSAISDSSQHGIYCNSSSPAISGNTISNNAQFGIYLISANATITDNTINNNSYGIYASNKSLPIIMSNTIRGNTQYGLYNSDSAVVIDAENNNWGDISGPLDDSDDIAQGGLYNPDGLGDHVSDHVDYYPWQDTKIGTTSVPVGLKGQVLPGKIYLSWLPNQEAWLGGYKIYYGTEPGEYGLPVTLGREKSYELMEIDAEKTYYIAISSYNIVGDESDKSGEIEAIPFVDTDQDGMDDNWEIEHFGSLLHDGHGDSDLDGLTDLEEYLNGTNPNNPDTDGDGMDDGWEVQFGLNPRDAADADQDLDGDCFTNLQEYLAGTDPTDKASIPPDLVTDTDFLTVPEGSLAQFTVRLSAQPQKILTVEVEVLEGDPDIRVKSGNLLTFDPGNWDEPQVVRMIAAWDADDVNGRATVRVSLPGISHKDIEVSEEERPLPEAIYVDDDAPGDPGPGDPDFSDPEEDGSSSHPFDAIQEAIDHVCDGIKVQVADGNYRGGGNHNIGLRGKAIMLSSENGATETTIDCEDTYIGFVINEGEGPATIIKEFTITRGFSGEIAGAINCIEASPSISECIIEKNKGETGGGIYCESSEAVISACTIINNTSNIGGGLFISGGSVTLINNMITQNISSSEGGGIGFSGGSSVITNCTIAENNALNGGGLSAADFADVNVINGICWNNAGSEVYEDEGSEITMSYSCVKGGYEGEGNIDDNPLFVGGRDYHLKAGSPCIDAGATIGAPDKDIDGDERPYGDGYDMGADEWVRTPCDGDINGDGEITPQDALCAFQTYLGICPTSCDIPCEDVCCDVTQDGECTPADALCIFRKYLGLPSCLD